MATSSASPTPTGEDAPAAGTHRALNQDEAITRDLLQAVLSSDHLARAWKRVKANKGALGIDGVTVDAFPTRARVHWPERDQIRARTKRNEGNSLAYVIASLNPTRRGWYGYFQHAHRFTFSSIDGFVRRRLRAVLRRQKHRPGHGRCLRDHQQWPNAFFADLGLFTMSETHRSARQSR